jgi:hypothetical protein
MLSRTRHVEGLTPLAISNRQYFHTRRPHVVGRRKTGSFAGREDVSKNATLRSFAATVKAPRMRANAASTSSVANSHARTLSSMPSTVLAARRRSMPRARV